MQFKISKVGTFLNLSLKLELIIKGRRNGTIRILMDGSNENSDIKSTVLLKLFAKQTSPSDVTDRSDRKV